MTEEFENKKAEEISSELARKAVIMKLKKEQNIGVNFGFVAALGGVIIVPILLGIWGGTFLDKHYPVRFSWRLSLIFCGFVWGMINAYYWIKLEETKTAESEQKLQAAIDQEMKK